jgi:hypothetical protein
MKTEYIKLTDLWYSGKYNEVGSIINKESWSASRVADFCFYFAKHLGLRELEILHKFL